MARAVTKKKLARRKEIDSAVIIEITCQQRKSSQLRIDQLRVSEKTVSHSELY